MREDAGARRLKRRSVEVSVVQAAP